MPPQFKSILAAVVCLAVVGMCAFTIKNQRATTQMPIPERNPNSSDSRIVTIASQKLTFAVSTAEKVNISDIQSYMHQMQAVCPNDVRMGNKLDGGWNVCVTSPFSLRPSCLVYSFGIAGDWSFDDAISAMYQCRVLAFDPSIHKGEHNRSELIWFHPFGLDNTTTTRSGWHMFTLKELRIMFNHATETIDVLKIDIEGDEWVSLDAAIRDGSINLVRQLAVEVHTPRNKKEHWTTLQNLYRLGFRLWKTHDNPRCKHCFELYFINTRYMVLSA